MRVCSSAQAGAVYCSSIARAGAVRTWSNSAAENQFSGQLESDGNVFRMAPTGESSVGRVASRVQFIKSVRYILLISWGGSSLGSHMNSLSTSSEAHIFSSLSRMQISILHKDTDSEILQKREREK